MIRNCYLTVFLSTFQSSRLPAAALHCFIVAAASRNDSGLFRHIHARNGNSISMDSNLLFILVTIFLLFTLPIEGNGEFIANKLAQEKASVLRELDLSNPPTGIIRNREYERELDYSRVPYQPVTNEGSCLLYDSNTPIPSCFQFSLDRRGVLLESLLSVLPVHDLAKYANLSIFVYDVNQYEGDLTLIGRWELDLARTDTGQYISFSLIDYHQKANFMAVKRAQRHINKFIKIEAHSNGQMLRYNDVFLTQPSWEVFYGQEHTKPTPPPENCNESGECCLKPFYVNFTEIGWTDWIISPPGYWANYCVGRCVRNPDNAITKILSAARSNSTFFAAMPQPRCTPNEYGSIRFKYYAGANDIRDTVLHGMATLGCGC